MRYTDEKHYVSVKDIQRYLMNNFSIDNVDCETITNDIYRLINMGNNIVKINKAHNEACYSLVDKGFTNKLIWFILYSVSINKFLTKEIKRKIIRSFDSMCSEEEIHKLMSRIVTDEVCPPSLDLLDNLEKIHTIIADRKEINFQYGKFDKDKQMIYYYKKRSVIPVNVKYVQEHFYLNCFNELDGKWRTYRIDRMKDITSGKKYNTAIPEEKKYDCFVADIFRPDYVSTVKLKVKRYLLNEMFEFFGKYSTVTDEKKYTDAVEMKVRAGINKHFYLWLMKYGDGIEVLGPENIRNEFYKECLKMIEPYEKKQSSEKE